MDIVTGSFSFIACPHFWHVPLSPQGIRSLPARDPEALPDVPSSSDTGRPIGGVQIHRRLPNTPWHAQCEGKIPSSLPKVPYGTHGDWPHKHYLPVFCFVFLFFCLVGWFGFFPGGLKELPCPVWSL